MTSQGKMICIEGPDGVGKTTAVSFLSDYLRFELGLDVTLLRLPGGSQKGEEIRKRFKSSAHEMSVYEQIELLIQAKHYALEETVKPALARGSYVICDRFTDSLFAYQWAGFSKYDPDVKNTIIDLLLLEQIDVFPDLKIIMNCPTNVANDRMRQTRKELDSLDNETSDFKQRVREYYDTGLIESPYGSTVYVDTSVDLLSVQYSLRVLIDKLLS